MTPLPNPRRPHPYQISDSVFTPEPPYVVETYDIIGRHAPYNTEDMRRVHGPYEDVAAALAEWVR